MSFAALKPGLVLAAGPDHAGVVTVADIGLDVSGATAGVVEAVDVAGWLPDRSRQAHKWSTALWVVAGSPGMTGAAELCAGAALRAGASSVHLGSPGGPGPDRPLEAVGRCLPAHGWDADVLGELGRFRALVVGPGLGRSDSVRSSVRRVVAAAPLPVVVDADGLWALGGAAQAADVIAGRRQPTVLTPHDGELAGLATGLMHPGGDRLGDTRRLAARTGATVLRKGPTTIVAGPDGRVLMNVAGPDARLATAGTGDVLSGVIGAFLAMGIDGPEAAAAAAFVHARAAGLGWKRGLLAGDLLTLVPAGLGSLRPEDP